MSDAPDIGQACCQRYESLTKASKIIESTSVMSLGQRNLYHYQKS